ncbi:hypothetical protein OSTOST_19291, partial [Ostertagia ostertagi]
FKPRFYNKTDMSVFIGSKCLNPEQCLKRRRVKMFWAHKDWDPCTQVHDIAIVELHKDVVVTKEVAPICLPSPGLKLAPLLRAAGPGMNREFRLIYGIRSI